MFWRDVVPAILEILLALRDTRGTAKASPAPMADRHAALLEKKGHRQRISRACVVFLSAPPKVMRIIFILFNLSICLFVY
jgi:hypothetical protein